VLALTRAPLDVRMNIGTWQVWNAAQASMPDPGAIGFFSQDPPAFTLPYAGQDFRRAVVSLGPYPWPGHGPQPAGTAIAAMMDRAGARYLYLVPGTVAYQVIMGWHGAPLRVVSTFNPGSRAFGGTVLERYSADLVRHRGQ
jgi:hypothetical protein